MSVVFPTHNGPSKVVQPTDGSFDDPATFVSTELSLIGHRSIFSSLSCGADQVDSFFDQASDCVCFQAVPPALVHVPIPSDRLESLRYSTNEDGTVFGQRIGAGGLGTGIRKYPEFELQFDDKAALAAAIREFEPIAKFGDLREVLKVVVNGDPPSQVVALNTLFELRFWFDANEIGCVPLLINAAYSDNFYVMKASVILLSAASPTDETFEALEAVFAKWLGSDSEGVSRVTQVYKDNFERAIRREKGTLKKRDHDTD